MTKEYIRISELVARDKLEIIASEEKAELNEWLESDILHQQIYDKISIEKDIFSHNETERTEMEQKSWMHIENALKRKKIRIYYRWSIVACISILLIATSLIFIKQNQAAPEFQLVDNTTNIKPGQQKAVLLLSDGQEIILNDSSQILSLNGGFITNTHEGLTYQTDTFQKKERMNILIIPKGGEYKLLLADGTKVWLNSDSRLIYPEGFTGEKRQVELHGEAYFEVTKDTAKPFIVKTERLDIQVLGTKFNIKSYDEEKQTTATLIGGSVVLTAGNNKVILKPDQQAIVTTGEEQISIKEVDAADYAAWREGKFVFRRERLEVIMETIARWYNVELFYQEAEAKEIYFSGKMNRYEQINELLDVLQKTGKLKFELKNNVVIISSK